MYPNFSSVPGLKEALRVWGILNKKFLGGNFPKYYEGETPIGIHGFIIIN